MPNHLHGILVIHPCRGGSRSAPTGTAPTQTNPTDTPVKIKPLGGLIGAFKTVSTEKWNELNNMTGVILWQRNYYEHIIRNGDEWERISRYIIANPIKWAEDENFPLGKNGQR